jgi:hypothetical protein
MNRKIIKIFNTNYNEFSSGNIVQLDTNSKINKTNISLDLTKNSFLIKTRLYQLNACKKILMLQSIFSELTRKKINVTEDFIKVSIRVYTDSNEYYFNGTSWQISNSLFCTEKQACENLNLFTFPANKKIGFIIKVEKDVNYIIGTKVELSDIRILCQCNLNHTEDYLYKTFCNKLETECQGQSRVIMDNFIGSKFNMISLIDESQRLYKNATPFEVYNLTVDENEITNLFSSYNSVTGECQLNSSISTNCKLIIYFKYNPTVQVSKSVDYYEIASIPSITVFDFQEMITHYGSHKYGISIFNNDTGEGYVSYFPKTCDYEFQAFVDVKSNYDYLYLKEGFQKWIRENIMLKTWGMDEEHDMLQITGFDDGTIPSMSDVRHGIIRIQIQNVILYELDSYQEVVVKTLNYDLKKKE